MKKFFLILISVCLLLYVGICIGMYAYQEDFIFFPEKLGKEYVFHFDIPFEEINVKVEEGTSINGLLFKADSSKGLVFYLHGNAGSLQSWGGVADTYTELAYDVFILDYRGFGKSEGEIRGEEAFFKDIQLAYDEMKKRYEEDKIVVLGYSIGTGAAAWLASKNQPKLLILQAPYYSLTDMMEETYPILPTFMLKYRFETFKYVKACKMPIVIFHGDMDEVIYYGSSLKLKEIIKKGDRVITLEGAGHNGMSENKVYRSELKKILE